MNGLLVFASLALGVGVACFLPADGAPAVLLCASAALTAALLIRRSFQDGLVLKVFVAALLFRLSIAVVIYVFNMQEYFGGDALTYDDIGWTLLQHWRGEISLDLYQEYAAPRLHTNWGMSYLTAAVYGVTGRNMLAVQFFNSVIGAATAPLIYRCAHHLFGDPRVDRLSLLLIAFWPSLALWSAQGLKDGPIMLLLAAVFLMTLKLRERLRVSYYLILVCSLLCLLSLRFYIFYIAAASIVGSYVLALSNSGPRSALRQVASITLITLALALTGITRTASTQVERFGNLNALQRARSDQARYDSGYGRDFDVSTPAGALGALPNGIAYLLFAPFPWQISNVRRAITMPEMLGWWYCFPALIIGLGHAVRFKLRQALPILLFTLLLTLVYAVFQSNVGTAYRQRSQLMEFYFIFISAGFVRLGEGRGRPVGSQIVREAAASQESFLKSPLNDRCIEKLTFQMSRPTLAKKD